MEKEILRKQGIARLTALEQNPELKQAKEAAIYAKLFASPFWQAAKSIGVVLSMGNELNTQPIIDQAFKENKTVAVPKVFPKRQLKFFEITPDTQYSSGVFGIREPIVEVEFPKTSIDLLLVPGVAFCQTGYRIGFGGGYYDRYLQDFTGTTCSVLFAEQLIENWQPEGFDIPVEHLITDE